MKLKAIACSFEIKPFNGRIQLFPFGRFYPKDGRPEGENGWYVDDSNGFELANQINSAEAQFMIDYEHQTLYVAQNGQGNPAAGWIVKADYISGEGLFADVNWTDKARWEIKDKIYRYISPLFIPAEDGKVLEFINAALTNTPALPELAEAYALSRQSINQSINQLEEKPMLELLRQLFALPEATEEEISAKLTALSASRGESKVAFADVYNELNKKEGELVALAAKVNQQQPDPTQYVPLSAMKSVQNELNSLRASIEKDKRDALIQVALADGRLLPAQRAWAESLTVVALSDYLAVAPSNPALQGMQTRAGNPNDVGAVKLSAAEQAAARALGMTEAQFIKEHKDTKEQAE